MSYLQMQDPTLERSFRGHKDVITGLAFKPSMTQLASSSMDHSVMIWNFKPQLRAFRFVGHKAPVTSLDFSSTGHLLASSSRDKTVRLWTPNVKGDVTVFKAHTSTVRTVQFSSDNEQLLTASDDKTIKLWSTHRTRFQFTLAGHLNWVRTACFSPDCRLVVSGSDDKAVKLWDLNSKSCIKTYWDHTGMVSSVAFHPSGSVIASASTDRSIKLFDIRMHKLMQHYNDAHAVSPSVLDSAVTAGGVNSIAFGGQNGEWLISTGMDGVVKIWDIKEGHLFYTLHGHKQGATTSAIFSPKGDYFATGGSDSQVMVWKSNFDDISRLEQVSGLDEPVRRGPHATSGFPHHSHPINTDNAERQPINPKFRAKTPPISNELPIKSAASGVTFRKIGDIAEPPLPGSKKHVAPEIIDIGSSNEVEYPMTSNKQPAESNAGETSFQDIGVRTVESLEIRNSSDQITSTLQHIVHQIDVLTQTMSILESRLSMNEDRVIAMAKKVQSDGLPSNVPASEPAAPNIPRVEDLSNSAKFDAH